MGFLDLLLARFDFWAIGLFYIVGNLIAAYRLLRGEDFTKDFNVLPLALVLTLTPPLVASVTTRWLLFTFFNI